MLIRIAAPLLGPNVLAALRIGMATLTLAVLMRAMRHTWPRPCVPCAAPGPPSIGVNWP